MKRVFVTDVKVTHEVSDYMMLRLLMIYLWNRPGEPPSPRNKKAFMEFVVRQLQDHGEHCLSGDEDEMYADQMKEALLLMLKWFRSDPEEK